MYKAMLQSMTIELSKYNVCVNDSYFTTCTWLADATKCNCNSSQERVHDLH